MKTYDRHSIPRIPVPRIGLRRSSDFGNAASLPFSVPVTLHDKGNAPQGIEAPFVSAFQGQESDKVVILYQDYEENKAGLYAYDQNAWHFVVAFSFVTNFVVNGGSCHVYVDPISEQTPPTGSIIFNDGEPVAGGSIPAGTGWWAALEYNFVYQLQPATTATLGGVIVKDGLDVDAGGNLSTAIQKVAGVSPDGSHDVPLAVANIEGAAPLESPNFTGSPTAPTQAATDNSTKIATTAFSQAMYDNRIGDYSYIEIKDVDTTLDVKQLYYRMLIFAGTLTAARTITFPMRGMWTVSNQANQDLLLKSESNALKFKLLAGQTIDVFTNNNDGEVWPTDAPLMSPQFTGIPAAPTAMKGTNTDQIATTRFVQNAVEDVQLKPATTSTLGGVIVKEGLNVDAGGNLSTAIQKVAGVSPDGSHDVPLSVSNIPGAAPLASPSFTGEPQAPTQDATDNSARIATTAFSQAMYGMRIQQSGDRSWMHYDYTLTDAEVQCRILYWTARDSGSPVVTFPVKTGRWLIINNSGRTFHCRTEVQASGTYFLVPAQSIVDVYAVDTTGNDEAQSIFEVPASYRLPIANTTTLGGVIVKEGLNVDASGNLSTAIQRVAGVSPDATHNVPLAVTDITGAAPLDSPTLTGLPTTPYPDLVFQQYKNSNQIASLRFVTDRQLSVASVNWAGIVSKDIVGDSLAHDVLHWTGTPNGNSAVGSFATTWGRWLIVNDTGAQMAVKTSVQKGGTYLTLGPGTHDVYAIDTTGNPNAQSMFEVPSSYRLPVATTATLGGVIVGNGLAVSGSGTISVDTNDAIDVTVTEGWQQITSEQATHRLIRLHGTLENGSGNLDLPSGTTGLWYIENNVTSSTGQVVTFAVSGAGAWVTLAAGESALIYTTANNVTQKAALAPINSPGFTGNPTAPTPTQGDNSTKLATTAFVDAALKDVQVKPATTTTLGGVIVKDGLSIDGSGNLSTKIQKVAGVGPGSDNNVALKVDNITGAAPLDSPSFIGNPKAPTPDVTNDSTTIATTEWYSEIIQSAYVRNWDWYDWDIQGDELRRRVMYWTGSPGGKTVATFYTTGGRWLLINESSGTIYVKTNKQTSGTYLAIPKGSAMDVYAIDTSDPSAQSMFQVGSSDSSSIQQALKSVTYYTFTMPGRNVNASPGQPIFEIVAPGDMKPDFWNNGNPNGANNGYMYIPSGNNYWFASYRNGVLVATWPQSTGGMPIGVQYSAGDVISYAPDPYHNQYINDYICMTARWVRA